MAANAAVQALEELESRWRPLRLDGDATAATWLVSAERGFASTLGTQAKWLSCCILGWLEKCEELKRVGFARWIFRDYENFRQSLGFLLFSLFS